MYLYLVFTFGLFALTAVFIYFGHKAAVEKSEASLRAKFNSGEYSEASRKLMREAGYNV